MKYQLQCTAVYEIYSPFISGYIGLMSFRKAEDLISQSTPSKLPGITAGEAFAVNV